MLPDWQTLFAFGPLDRRALQLSFDGLPVWFAATSVADLQLLPAGNFLTAGEQERAARFRFDPPREHFMLGRLAAKLTLAAARGSSSLVEFEIQNGDSGEPIVTQPAGSSYAVSISHSGGLAVALAFPSHFPMGIDLEGIDAVRADTVHQAVALSPAEKTWVNGGELDAATAGLAIWAAREALGKLLRCGLSRPWEELAVGAVHRVDRGQWRCEYQHETGCAGWLWAGEKHVLAIAYRRG